MTNWLCAGSLAALMLGCAGSTANEPASGAQDAELSTPKSLKPATAAATGARPAVEVASSSKEPSVFVTPAPLFTQQTPCRAQRVASLSSVAAVASSTVAPWLAPNLLSVPPEAGGSSLDLDRIARALFGDRAPPRHEVSVDICMKLDSFRNYVKSDSVQVFDIKRASFAASAMSSLVLVLWSNSALSAVTDEGTATWHLSVFSDQHVLLGESVFDTERDVVRTLDGVGAELELDGGLVSARVGFGCASKNAERFEVPIQLSSSPVCARAMVTPYPPTQYPVVLAQPRCEGAAVTRLRPTLATSRYEATHADTDAWWGLPPVQEEADAADVDWRRLLLTVSPAEPEPKRADERAWALVGSAGYTTAQWSYVKGNELRLHQLLALRDAAGKEGYLLLTSRQRPEEVLSQPRASWYLTLFSPGYELEAGVAFEVAPPNWQAGRYRALQTDLDIVQGQPVVRIRYLWRAPARTGEDDANAKLGSVFEVVKELALDLEHGCLAPRAP